MTFSKLVAVAALGPLFLWWVHMAAIYFSYDTMKYIRSTDDYFVVNSILFGSVALIDLVVFSITYRDILKKYYTLKYAKE